MRQRQAYAFLSGRTTRTAGLIALGLLAGCGDVEVVSPGGTQDGRYPPVQRPAPPPPTIGRVFDGFDDSHPNLQIATYVAMSGTQIRSVLVSGSIESDLILIAGVTYVLDGSVMVGVAGFPPATLTVMPGATIYGEGRNSALMISENGSIQAEGSGDAPIVFSSIRALERQNGVSVLDPESEGEWAGVRISAGQRSGAAVMRYVRIEYAGLMTDSALHLARADNSSILSHLHIHASGSTGVSLSGGSPHVTWLVISDPAGDGMTWEDGFAGSGQHILIVKNSDGTALTGSGDTTPRLANLSLVGSGRGSGLALTGTGSAVVLNSMIAGFATGITLSDSAAVISGRGRIGATLLDNVEDIGAAADADRVRETLRADGTVLDSPLATDVYIPGPAVAADFAVSLASYAPLRTTSHVSAFSPTDSTADNWTAGWTRSGTILTRSASCPERTGQAGRIAGRIVCALSGVIETDLTLANGDQIIYRLDGQVFVGTDGGPFAVDRGGSAQADLRIEAGVTIYGDGVSDGLVVTRGSRLFSLGTRDRPVRFTSGPALRGEVGPETRAQWLGLSINGKAPINKCDIVARAPDGSDVCQDEGEASSGIYGGNVATDSSGELRYTRVEYAGIFFTGEDQSNGIAFQGVGSGTQVSYVQVHNNGDDGMEFFGGTVRARYVVITGAGDDSIDWTDGWRGAIQFLIVEQSDGSDFALEGDNRSVSDPHRIPRSAPWIANFTIVGNAAGSRGARLREGSGGDLVNGVIADVSPALDIEDVSNMLLLSPPVAPDDGRLRLASLLIDADPAITDDEDEVSVRQVREAITDLSLAASTLSGFSFFGRPDIGVVPGVNEGGITAFDLTGLADFLEAAPYVGAVRDAADTWYLGWTIDGDANTTGPEQ